MEILQKDHRITMAAAIAMTKRFRNGRAELVQKGLKSDGVLPTCETFDRSGFDMLLAQKGCVGVRAYFAMNEQGQVHLVFVGVNEQGCDILPAEGNEESLATEEGVLLDRSSRCPDDCPTPSPLNS